MFVILHNIRSIHNVGSIFRTADAAGVAKIYLCGITPSPLDRFGRVRRDFAKVSLGAERTMAWEKCRRAGDVIKKLKKDGFKILAIEQDKRAVPYWSYWTNEADFVIASPEGARQSYIEIASPAVGGFAMTGKVSLRAKRSNLMSLRGAAGDEAISPSDTGIASILRNKFGVPRNDDGTNKTDKIALILGNEVRGLPQSILNKCDKILEILMRGQKESLNVAVAFGVVVFNIKDTTRLHHSSLNLWRRR